VVAVAGLLTAGWLALSRQPSPALTPEPQGDDRKADREAVVKATQAFAAAVEKGDVKQLAELWTAEAEYIADSGDTLRGRAAIEAAYQAHFEKTPGLKVEMTTDSVRFVSKDSAIEEGYARVQGKNGFLTNGKYSILHVREGGKWLIAVLRDWPSETYSLRDLDWLVGSWVSKHKGTEVKSTYAWDEHKKFLVSQFTVKGPERSISGTQRIGRDPRTGQVRSWVFDSEGGFGEAAWTWDGKRWTQEATGVHADGTEIKATNLLIPLDRDTFTWQSIERTSDGAALPDIAPVKVTRVK
jgi:uncharacterized protein (TIGR02246 family)